MLPTDLGSLLEAESRRLEIADVCCHNGPPWSMAVLFRGGKLQVYDSTPFIEATNKRIESSSHVIGLKGQLTLTLRLTPSESEPNELVRYGGELAILTVENEIVSIENNPIRAPLTLDPGKKFVASHGAYSYVADDSSEISSLFLKST